MARSKNTEKATAKCAEQHQYIDIPINKLKIKHMLLLAKNNADIAKKIPTSTNYECSVVFKLYYDCLKSLSDAILRLDGKKSASHYCCFAYVCKKTKIPLKLFEELRQKRNKIQYYGEPISRQYWLKEKEKIEKYIRILKQFVKKQAI